MRIIVKDYVINPKVELVAKIILILKIMLGFLSTFSKQVFFLGIKDKYLKRQLSRYKSGAY